MSKQPPPALTASTIGPCPTIIQVLGRPGTGSLPRTIAPPDHSHFANSTSVKANAEGSAKALSVHLCRQEQKRN